MLFRFGNVKNILYYFTIFISMTYKSSNLFASDTTYFKSTYEEADADFQRIFAATKNNYSKAEIHNFLYDQGNIKSYYFKPSENSNTLVITISGVHGAEGPAGSAVQRFWTEKLPKNEKVSFLHIHGFNLWGFKNFRRVNENNVDLNRNFILDRNAFKPDDTGYKKLNDFLNPNTSVGSMLLSKLGFYFNAAVNLAQNSIETLRVSILKGQYFNSKGIFYGGINPQEQELLLEQLIDRYLKTYKQVFIIDLHTGYGERGRLHLLAGPKQDENSKKLLSFFKEDEVNFADQNKFYGVTGELNGFFATKIKQKTSAEVTAITFEFGTMNSQKTAGSIESLRRMVNENRAFHYGGDNDSVDKIKEEFREMFYPSDEDWRAKVLSQSEIRIRQVINGLN